MKGRKPLSNAELIDTVVSVRGVGIKTTAEKMYLVPASVTYRIKRAEHRFGVKFFSDYGYNRMTYLGREKLNELTRS